MHAHDVQVALGKPSIVRRARAVQCIWKARFRRAALRLQATKELPGIKSCFKHKQQLQMRCRVEIKFEHTQTFVFCAQRMQFGRTVSLSRNNRIQELLAKFYKSQGSGEESCGEKAAHKLLFHTLLYFIHKQIQTDRHTLTN